MLALIVGIIIGVLGALVLRGVRRLRANDLKVTQLSTPGVGVQPPLSWPSKQVLKEYKALPESSQIYGDITETLQALDTKHDRKLLNSHFYLGPDEFHDATNVMTWGGGESWIGGREGTSVDPGTGETKRHEHHGCIGSEHYALHVAIEEISKALRDKEKAIELAGVEHVLEQVPSLLEALKTEAEANRP